MSKKEVSATITVTVFNYKFFVKDSEDVFTETEYVRNKKLTQVQAEKLAKRIVERFDRDSVFISVNDLHYEKVKYTMNVDDFISTAKIVMSENNL